MTNDNIESLKQIICVSEYQNAVNVTEALVQLLICSYTACPAFVIGLLEDAFKLAFHSKTRPLLIYIHHNNSAMTNQFCSELLCSNYLIEYLHENYIVWSWDITEPYNGLMLMNMWKKIFPETRIVFSIDECPLLIGVMRVAPLDGNSDLPPSYGYAYIRTNDCLAQTRVPLNLESLLDQLIVFKEEFDANDAKIAFSVDVQASFSWELRLGIAEFLSLDDAVSAFSSVILQLLADKNIKLPLVNPSIQFIKTMMQKVDNKQILLLSVPAHHFQPVMKFAPPNKFSQVPSLHVYNLKTSNELNNIKNYMPNLIYFCIHYEDKIDFHLLVSIFNLTPGSIKQVKLDCNTIPCSHYRNDYAFTKITSLNRSVEELIFNIDHTRTSLVNDCVQYYEKCILRTIIDFTRIMSKIRCIWIIVNSGDIETWLDINEWTSLAQFCTDLTKIIIKVRTNKSNNMYLQEKIQQISNALGNQRQPIQFQFTFETTIYP